ncbi:MAG: hypothetical protein JWO32_2132 [Bacteroidetes bacterium]|nr:hypothetical protein [Bacteroidota bacterium]
MQYVCQTSKDLALRKLGSIKSLARAWDAVVSREALLHPA